MAKRQKKKKMHTIAGRSLLSMVLMGLLMIVATSIAASWELVQQSIDIYEDYASSYAKTVATNINGDWITEYMKLDQNSAEADVDKEALEQLQLEAMSGGQYQQVASLLMTSVSFANLRYMYVVVPEEEDLVYIWDAMHLELDEDTLSSRETQDLHQLADFLEHDSYTREEEGPMKATMEGTWEGEMFVDSDYQGLLLGTCLAPIHDREGKIVAVAGVDVDLADLALPIVTMCLNIFLAVTIILVFCMIIYYFVIKRGLIRPIVKLEKASQELVKNLDTGKTFQVDIHTGDEIEALSKSFEEMDVRLHRYLDENLAITAEQERIKTELDMAKRIQAGMLPSKFPPFPDRKEFDIYASMQPAKEVGGDFYDFFLVDDDHLALVIADVSGKGVPAALFMMVSMIMLQNYTTTGMSPKEVFEKVNNLICKTQEEMFVTVWLGILDIRTGVITAANAGHEYPMLKNARGEFELIKDKHGLVIGGIEDISYEEYQMKLEPGSKLFVYTDGVAEATDPQNQLFGTARTLDALNSGMDGTPQELLETVQGAVDLFVGEAPQFDDLTMLCLSYYGENGVET